MKEETVRELIVDGRFLQQQTTGVQRFAVEIMKGLAGCKEFFFTVAVPGSVEEFPFAADNIRFEKVGKHGGIRWEQFDLARYCKKRKLPLLCLCNTIPIRCRAFIVLHDTLWLDLNKSETDPWLRRKSQWMIHSFANRNLALFTVSEFSAARIRAHYPRSRPIVLGNGWEHVKEWKETAVEGLPQNFYLSVGSIKPHKNFGYVLALAKNCPEKNFVIVGGKNQKTESFLTENGLKNCFFTGYLDDGSLKWLYARAEGFILPSLYEGFGIPPLEAVACGCKKLFLSDIPVFKEVYGDVANFFDPNDQTHTADLDAGKEISPEEREALLKKFSWERYARELAGHIKQALGEKK